MSYFINTLVILAMVSMIFVIVEYRHKMNLADKLFYTLFAVAMIVLFTINYKYI